MARLPPLWSQLGSYPASVDRRLIGALWPAGGVDGMAPTVQVATMNISIAAGTAVVPDSRIAMAAYLCPSDASELVALPAAPPAGQDRIDLVVVRPRDAAYGGADTDWIFDLVAGTPAANPSVPSVPAGTLAIAQQRVIGGAAFITAANLVDRRPGNLAVAAERPHILHGTGGMTLTAAANVQQFVPGLSLTVPPGRWALSVTGFIELSVGANIIVFIVWLNNRTTVQGLASCQVSGTASDRRPWTISTVVDVPAPQVLDVTVQRNIATGTQLFQSAHLIAIPE